MWFLMNGLEIRLVHYYQTNEKLSTVIYILFLFFSVERELDLEEWQWNAKVCSSYIHTIVTILYLRKQSSEKRLILSNNYTTVVSLS